MTDKDKDRELPSIWQLRVFETVARLESVTRASQELLRSQPATTSCIAAFEGLLGVSLFERSTTGIYLTAVGVAVQVRARKILDAAAEAVSLIPHESKISALALAARITRTQMRCLSAIAECQSFRGAARSLGITEASLQRAARTLEQNLGSPLYRHTASGVTTTELGEELAHRLKLISGQIAGLVEAALSYESPRERSVTVGVLLLDPSILIVNAIRETTAEFPDARVIVISGTYEALINKLIREEIDFIIGILKNPSVSLGLVEEPLFQERYCVVARRNHPLTKQKQVSIEQLGDYPWVLPPKGSPRRQAYEHLFSEGAPPPASIETYSLSTIRISLSDTEMLTILSWTEMLSERRFGLLTTLPVDVSWNDPIVGITRHRDWRPNPLQEAFLSSLRRNSAAIVGTTA